MTTPQPTPDSPRARAAYLRTLPAIRARCRQVHDLAKHGALHHFDYHPEKLEDVITFCASIIERDFARAFNTIPPHGRWRHLDSGQPRVEPLLQSWSAAGVDATERCKRLLDLILVSVLLDAGAGSAWSYEEPGTGRLFSRSEGLGVASVHMFTAGLFSGSASQPYRVDAQGLASITVDRVSEAMQVSVSNPMVGLAGRAELLIRLSTALASHPQFFGEDARPGNLLDYLATQATTDGGGDRLHVPLAALWSALIDGLSSIWPSRHTLGGVPLGDVWPCLALHPSAKDPQESAPGSEPEEASLVPFHKLTGWLTYSLVEPIQALLGWAVDGMDDLTGLPEYRNGGLLIDLGVLTLRRASLAPSTYPDENSDIPRLPPSHPAIVEWRAMTVIELDRIAQGLRDKYGLDREALTLAQVLESATWKGGREIAKIRRPETGGGPPIDIISDGTVF